MQMYELFDIMADTQPSLLYVKVGMICIGQKIWNASTCSFVSTYLAKYILKFPSKKGSAGSVKIRTPWKNVMKSFFTNAGWMKVIPLEWKSHRGKKYIQFDLFSCYFVGFLKNLILTNKLTSIKKASKNVKFCHNFSWSKNH